MEGVSPRPLSHTQATSWLLRSVEHSKTRRCGHPTHRIMRKSMCFVFFFKYWVLVTFYVAKANWYTFILCYFFHVNLSPNSPNSTFWGWEPPAQKLLKLYSGFTVLEKSLFCTSGVTVTDTTQGARMAVVTRDHLSFWLEQHLAALMGARGSRMENGSRRCHNKDSLTVRGILKWEIYILWWAFKLNYSNSF